MSKLCGQLVVKGFCSKALQAGVREGTSLAQAKILAPRAIIATFLPSEDLTELRRLAQQLLKFSPIVSLDPALTASSKNLEQINPVYNGLVLDLTGTERLYPNEEQPALKLLSLLGRGGFSAKIGVASTLGAAWALSRYGSARFNSAGKLPLAEALANLPIEALRLESKTIQALQQVGIGNLKQLFLLPSKSLLTRFGPKLLERTYQILGYGPEAVTTVKPPQPFCIKRSFETPLANAAAVKICLLRQFSELLGKLLNQKRRAGSFEILIEGFNNDGSIFKVAKEMALRCASTSFSHVSSIVTPFAEGLCLPGPVSSMRVTALQIGAEIHIQQDLSRRQSSSDTKRASAELFDHLLIRLGAPQVRRLRYDNSHLPERSFTYQPLDAASSAQPAAPLKDRPPYLCGTPLPIQAVALLPDRPPARLCCQGKNIRILAGYGPERIAVPWWPHPKLTLSSSRDYFKVQDQSGRWLWIFRNNQDQTWFLHGAWS